MAIFIERIKCKAGRVAHTNFFTDYNWYMTIHYHFNDSKGFRYKKSLSLTDIKF